jgi:hypothetical protein
MTKLKANLENIKKVVEEQVIPVLNKVNNTEVAHDPEDLFKEIQAPQNQETGQQISTVIANFKAAIRTNWTFISLMRKNLSNKDYQQRAVVSKGVLNEAIESSGLLGGHGLVSNEFEDVVRALGTVYTDLVTLNKSLDECITAAKQKISGMKSESETETESIVGPSTSPSSSIPASPTKSTDFGIGKSIGNWADKWTKKMEHKL